VADGWIPSLGYVPGERLPVLRAAVLAAAEKAGRSADAITCALNLEVHLDDAMTASDDLVAGPADVVAERLARLVALGFTTLNLKVPAPGGADRARQVRRIATEVLPLVRAAM
jgi:tagatose-1,6-bisphosphate aldolase non-catalytic subunit AgaZ/GatZ